MTETAHIQDIAESLSLPATQIRAVADLIDEGATIPFIARYRKERTGSLDEVAVTAIRDRLRRLAELDARKAAILKSLDTHGHLTDELGERVRTVSTLAALEDLYLPYRPKRRTRGATARERGLGPLADLLSAQAGIDPEAEAEVFVDPGAGVATPADALAGARDIIAERVNEDEAARAEIRDLFTRQGAIRSTVIPGREADGAKYRDYFDWSEPVATAPSHRILAMRRAEAEDVLSVTIAPPEETALGRLTARFVRGTGADADQVRTAVHDAYRRLLCRSMETEIRLAAKERADAEAIRVFSENLRQLLLAPPLGAKRVMGIDPGFRTGCKVVCLDRQGKLLAHETVYLHQPDRAADRLRKLAHAHEIEAVAVGNGTAGRETEQFVRSAIPSSISVVAVNESGASIYSASEAARAEFPDLDLTVRGAVSIGRRLMDPLSELVKIDPKSIGVGQYQHDVDGRAMKAALDDVVVSCVNGVGVDVNRASVELLTYVSGLGPQLARNIVAHRNDHGPFNSRSKLLTVHRLGPKAFEQSAGFLRIADGANPLDASAVHPERYPVVDAMAGALDCTVADLIKDAALRGRIRLEDYVTDSVGLPTLKDILAELARPGRDPRDRFSPVTFDAGVQSMDDLEAGMTLPGVVTNITAFGAFVDVGVHQDGLVHVSELADRFVEDPAEVVRVHQAVRVTVLSVDLDRKRIALSMKTNPGARQGRPSGEKTPSDRNGGDRPKSHRKSRKQGGV
jgi:protein Tex